MSIIIARFSNWLREKKEPMIIVIAVFVAITLSFALGYLLGRSDNPAPIVIEQYASHSR